MSLFNLQTWRRMVENFSGGAIKQAFRQPVMARAASRTIADATKQGAIVSGSGGLVGNGRFESFGFGFGQSPTGWFSPEWGEEIVRQDGATSVSGSNAIRFVGTAGGATGTTTFTSDPFLIEEGQDHRLRIFVDNQGTVDLTFRVVTEDLDGADLSTFSEVAGPTTGYEDHYLWFRADAGARTARVELVATVLDGPVDLDHVEMIICDEGDDYQIAEAPALASTTSTSFVTRLTLTTPKLVGEYHIMWMCYGMGASGKDSEFQLYNLTGAAAMQSFLMGWPNTSHHWYIGGFERFDFGATAVSKTFEVRYRSVNPPHTTAIEETRIVIWRAESRA